MINRENVQVAKTSDLNYASISREKNILNNFDIGFLKVAGQT